MSTPIRSTSFASPPHIRHPSPGLPDVIRGGSRIETRTNGGDGSPAPSKAVARSISLGGGLLGGGIFDGGDWRSSPKAGRPSVDSPEWSAGLPRLSARSHNRVLPSLGLDATAEDRPSSGQLSNVLPYVPHRTLASAAPQLNALRDGAKNVVATMQGAALLVDVAGFSSLARSFTRSDAATASEELCDCLNEYMLRLVNCLHARGADVLQFLGDAVVAFIAATPKRSLRAAAAAAVDAARAVRAIAFERSGHKLTAHTGIGVGEMLLYVLRGGPSAAQALYVGDLIVQVCEAQRASRGDDIVLSDEARRLLEFEEGLETRWLRGEAAAGASRPVHRLLPPSTAGKSRQRLVPLATDSLAGSALACGCGAALPEGSREAAAALRGLADEILSFVPAMAAEGHAGSFWAHDIRTVFCVFASFPELDAKDQGDGGAPTAERAARFGMVVRSVHRVAGDYGGSVNKIMIDEKGASALLGFGLPGGYAHEDDAERAVRAALALQAWFAETGAPFAAGVVGGRTFCGSLGAPCRKEHALIGDCVILAARLMGAARATIGHERSKAERKQEVLCDSSIATATAARGRRPGFTLEPLPPLAAKGFPDPVPVFRPAKLSEAGGAAAEAAGGARPSSEPAAGRAAAAAEPESVPCLGREAELQRAVAAIEALVAQGRGSTVVIEGDAGYGKTRLVEELGRACAARGVHVLRCASGALEEATPLWALRGMLASVADVATAEGFRADAASRGILSETDATLLWSCFFGNLDLPPGGKYSGSGSEEYEDEEEGGYRSYRNRANVTTGPYPDPDAKGGTNAKVGGGLGFGMVVVRVANALSRLVAALERGGGGGSPATRVALFLEDAQWIDSASWIVARCLRDLCPRVLLLVTTRPMADPPRDFLLLSGQAVDEAGQILVGKGIVVGPDGSNPPASRELVVAPNAADAEPSPKGGTETPPMLSEDEQPPVTVMPMNPPRVRPGRRHVRLPPLRAPVPVTLVRIGPLAREAASALLTNLSERMGVVWPPDVEAAVLAKAGGVPLFLVELCRQLRQTGPSTVMALLRSGTFAVPDTIQQIVLTRADRLSATAQAVLKLAAVVGADFTCEAVCAVDPTGEGGMGPANVWQGFLELRMAGLVAEREPEPRIDEFGWGGPGPNRAFNFLHTLTRDAIYGAIPGATRREVHGRLARWLEGRRREQDRDPAVLALHWRMAEQHEKGLGYLERAAKQAYRSSAFVEARRMFAELCTTVDEFRLCGPKVTPLAPHLRTAAPPPVARRNSTAGLPPASAKTQGTEEQLEQWDHWTVVRACSLRSWALIEYRMGRLTLAAELALNCLESLGERLPTGGSLLSNIGVVTSFVGMALRQWGAPLPSRRVPRWLLQQENREARGSVIDSFMIVVWVGVKGGLRGSGNAFGTVLAGLVRAMEISNATPLEMLGFPDVRIRSNFCMFLEMTGMRSLARSLARQLEELAEYVNDDPCRMTVAGSAALRHFSAGRFREGLFHIRCSIAYGGSDPLASDSHNFLCLGLAVTGSFAAAESACMDALSTLSRFGMDDMALLLMSTVDGWTSLLLRRDQHAASLYQRARQNLLSEGGAADPRVTGWSLETIRLIGAVLSWRRGEVEEAMAVVSAAAAFWRAQVKTAIWSAMPAMAIVLDFALWHRSRALERLRAATGEGLAPPSRLRRALSRLCGPSAHAERQGPSAAGSPNPSRRPSAAAPRRPSVVHSNQVAVGLPQTPATGRPSPPPADRRPSSGRDLHAAAARASAFADEVVALTTATARTRIAAMAPFGDLARAEQPGLPPRKRAALLRSARDGFARSGLRPWEVQAGLLLAQATGEAAAAQAAAAVAAETGLPLPPARPEGGYISLWVAT